MRVATTSLAWRGETPLRFTAEEIEHWGLESNAIVEPWDYPAA